MGYDDREWLESQFDELPERPALYGGLSEYTYNDMEAAADKLKDASGLVIALWEPITKRSLKGFDKRFQKVMKHLEELGVEIDGICNRPEVFHNALGLENRKALTDQMQALQSTCKSIRTHADELKDELKAGKRSKRSFKSATVLKDAHRKPDEAPPEFHAKI